MHRGPNLPGAEVFFSLTLQAASDGAEPPLSAPQPWRPIWGLSVPPRGAGPGRALGSAPSQLANFAGPGARRATPRAHVRAGCGVMGTSSGLGVPDCCCRRLGTKPPAGRRMETGGSALRRALAGALGKTHGEPGGQPRLRRRGASSDARASRPPLREEQRPPRPPQSFGRAAARRARRPPLPGLGSGEPLLPVPSQSCGGSVSW